MKSYFVYILTCSNGRHYTGVTNDLDRRLSEHQMGKDKNSYTYRFRPVKLAAHFTFNSIEEAISWEKRIKKWSQKKKKALIKGEFSQLGVLSKKSFLSGK